MKYKVDDNIILEDTGKVVVHNYPPNPHTYSYITRVYRQYIKNEVGWKEIEGESFYLHKLSPDIVAFAKIMAESQAAIDVLLPHEKHLTQIKS